MEKISFFTDDNEQTEMYLLMDTTLSGVTYVLVSDSDPEEEDCECYIMKKTGEEGEEATYEFVEDDAEYEALAKVFEELLDDEDIGLSY